MRLALTGLIAATLLTAQMAAAAPCANPIDQGAFDIAGLKSQLMVTALSCNMRDQYNRVVVRFRPDLMREERALNSYFTRVYGRRARQAHDDYITSLANTQSEAGVQRGNLFCREHIALFGSVLALRSGGELVSFAAHQEGPQPMTLVSCSTRPPVRRGSGYTRTAQAR
ncbi:MAG: hypothetical protein M3Y41_03330 [Pseudomonadota bacterium]|nr:hypothetical protein [Pseudomonadota bacterium]